MKLAAILAALFPMTAVAQGSWEDRVEVFLDGFEVAVSQENIVPYLGPFSHPLVVQASAEYLGMDAESFETSAQKGYAYSITISEITDFEMFRETATSGSVSGMPWTIVSYAISLKIDNVDASPASCVRLFVYERDDNLYAEQLGTELSAQIVGTALPELAPPIAEVAANCLF